MTNAHTAKLTLTNGSNTVTTLTNRAGLTRWVACSADGHKTEQVLTVEAARAHTDRLLAAGWVLC